MRTEVQHKKGATITLEWLSGDNYPPAVTIKKDDGELISWNFFKDVYGGGGGYYAEGIGRKGFYKCPGLGKDREKAVDTYYRLIAQTKRPKQKEHL